MNDAALIPASTIILAKDYADSYKVLMVERHHQIDFAAGALVFPGGKVDPQDQTEHFQPLLHTQVVDDAARALQVAAIREAFEESGILLARPKNKTTLISGERLKTLGHYRDKIHQNKLSFADFLAQEALLLANDQLQIFAHWITPKMMTKRFDTWFYLASAPAGQIASQDGHESVDSVWITPEQAFIDGESGKRAIIFPTMRNIAKLKESKTVEQALKQARQAELITIEPWSEQRGDGTYLCIDPKAGYDISAIKLPDRARPDRAKR